MSSSKIVPRCLQTPTEPHPPRLTLKAAHVCYLNYTTVQYYQQVIFYISSILIVQFSCALLLRRAVKWDVCMQCSTVVYIVYIKQYTIGGRILHVSLQISQENDRM